MVDDEPKANDYLTYLLKKEAGFEILEKFTDSEEALYWLMENKVDLAFLDIQMPGLSGLELVKALVDPPQVIFCTSYNQFASESYEVNAIDYLLKPIAADRFKQSIQKAKELILGVAKEAATVEDPYFFVKELGTGKTTKVNVDDVLYTQADGNNCSIYMRDSTVTTRMPFKVVREALGEKDFILTERSHLVCKHFIYKVGAGSLTLRGVNGHIPIGPEYAAHVRAYLKSKMLQ